ncbi:MAG: hypothetical protein ABI184_05250, partial [Ginsengibacter sp.]
AYPENELYSHSVRCEAHGAFESGDISEESYKKVEDAYHCKLYTPHFFIAVALGLLAVITAVFTGILAWLLTQVYSSSGIAALSAFLAVVCYFFLEWMVKNKSYFNAGIDNALMVLILVFSGGIVLSYSEDVRWILFSSLLMLVALWLCLRFADAFMAIVSCGFFLSLCFLLWLKSGKTAVEYFPVIMMLIIGTLYLFIEKAKKRIKFIYEKCLKVLTVFLLLAFYAAGNYWVINELQSSVTGAPGATHLAWPFWIFTFLMPLLCIVYGVIKKSLLYLRTGLVLVALAVFTYRYYYTFLPVETMMLVAGLLLVATGYFFIKWLQPARYGYSSESTFIRPAWNNAEAVIIGATMGGVSKTADNHLMDGGSGGGAGASGEY